MSKALPPALARTAERVQLRHPDAKKAPSIERDRYALIRKLMLATVPARKPGLTWVQLRSDGP